MGCNFRAFARYYTGTAGRTDRSGDRSTSRRAFAISGGKTINERIVNTMDLKEYLASLKGKTVAVLGIGVSNTPLVELLCRSGVKVVA